MNLDIQNDSGLYDIPANESIIEWVTHALDEQYKAAEITLRIVDIDEARTLNKEWRNKDTATNVLSFPIGNPIVQAPNLLGDIAICALIVAQEAEEQRKDIVAHWAHLIIHGILHLQGYDHESNEEAKIMETKEIQILKNIGYANPYEVGPK